MKEKVLNCKKLKEARVAKGMDVYQAGKSVQLSHDAIKLYEAGKREPKLATLKKLLEIYGLKANDVLDLPFA